MSSKDESYDDSVQIVEKVIEIELINNAVAKLQANSAEATDDMTTRLDWTSACDELLQFYRTKVHPEMILRPQIAAFVKSPAETASTFKMIERVNPSAQKHPIRRIRLPTDYHILIPLIIEGLPSWIEVRCIGERRKVPWTKGSAVYLKGGTDLVCSEKGGGVFILIGGKNKTLE